MTPMTVKECTTLLDADIILLVSLRQLNLSSPHFVLLRELRRRNLLLGGAPFMPTIQTIGTILIARRPHIIDYSSHFIAEKIA
jgi:hypothetical protein